jgi:hypothetical protein
MLHAACNAQRCTLHAARQKTGCTTGDRDCRRLLGLDLTALRGGIADYRAFDTHFMAVQARLVSSLSAVIACLV